MTSLSLCRRTLLTISLAALAGAPAGCIADGSEPPANDSPAEVGTAAQPLTASSLADQRVFIYNRWHCTGASPDSRCGDNLGFAGTTGTLLPPDAYTQQNPWHFIPVPGTTDQFYILNRWECTTGDSRCDMDLSWSGDTVKLVPHSDTFDWVPWKLVPVAGTTDQFYFYNQWGCNGVPVNDSHCGEYLGFAGMTAHLFPAGDQFDLNPWQIQVLGPPTDTDAQLADRFAPIIQFHPEEEHFPVRMLDFVQHSVLKNASGQTLVSYPQMLATVASSATGSKEDYLDVDSSFYTSGADAFNSSTPIYTHVVRYTAGGTPFIEIQYSMLFAYNACEIFLATSRDGDATTFPWCNFGRHEGDWEHVTVRLNGFTGLVADVYTNAHGKSLQHAPHELTFSGSHPVVFVALNSHGTHIQPGIKIDDTVIDSTMSTFDILIVPENLSEVFIVDWMIGPSFTTPDGITRPTSGITWPTSGHTQLIEQTPSITGYNGRWGNGRTDNSDVQDPTGNVVGIPDTEMMDFAQALFDTTHLLDNYRYGSGPNGPWTNGWWNGEGL